jgi:hypothetical protein
MAEQNIISKGRIGRTRIAWMTGALAVFAGFALLYWFNPVEHSFYPRCVFHSITGLDCPGCGGLRATHQLLHGHITAAFQLNPLLVCVAPFVVVFGARWFFLKNDEAARAVPMLKPSMVWISAIVVVAFGILRNLPWKNWLG